TSPPTTTLQGPNDASTTRTSARVTGSHVKSTPAQSATRYRCTTAPTRSAADAPTFFRYIVTLGAWADLQMAAIEDRSRAGVVTWRKLDSWPAKLARLPSSPTIEERAARGAPSARNIEATRGFASGRPAAIASTASTETAKPSGTGRPA